MASLAEHSWAEVGGRDRDVKRMMERRRRVLVIL